MPSSPADSRDLAALLAWQSAAGADEAIEESPVDRYKASTAFPTAAKSTPAQLSEAPLARQPAAPPTGQTGARQGAARPAPARPAPPKSAATPPTPMPGLAKTAAAASARELANAATSLEELVEALAAFDGCALKKTATNLVFGDGNPNARVMFVGEAPGADEDRAGKPFVGVSGQLLDKMVGWIGLDRTKFYITNIIYWRPPGNRTPTSDEVAACQPFIARHIELVAPAVLVTVGGPSTEALLHRGEGISRSHGRWYDYQTPGLAAPIPAIPIFHPAFLLRAAAQKRAAWRDLLKLEQKLAELGIS
jgi:uracil-DNA glycosylase